MADQSNPDRGDGCDESDESNGNDRGIAVPAVTTHEDITYAERDTGDLKLDLHVPDAVGPIPLLVYVHGGGWVFETRKNAPDLKRFAAEWECATASVSYRLAEIPENTDVPFSVDPENTTPNGVFPDQIVDVKAAVRWLRANADAYGFEPSAVAAWGASAGGHLAALAGVVDDITDLAGDVYSDRVVEPSVAPAASGHVQSVVSWYGISDLCELSGEADTVEALLLGGPVAENPDRARLASPIAHVTADAPPFLLLHGREDDVVAVGQSQRLFDELAAQGVDASFYELLDFGHVWGADSERTAMNVLTSEPRPEHRFTTTPQVSENVDADSTLDGDQPVGPDLIGAFLDRTL
ncbi:alpha/beta hydrolase fold domain-containing protein [Halorubrum sp. AS12]|uniref:alpha/beta hydrolase fold domain-containing protein n=1 Tax=Halorubrum sp. AS12 TaxID=3409687 RepID=UPI003DA70FF5